MNNNNINEWISLQQDRNENENITFKLSSFAVGFICMYVFYKIAQIFHLNTDGAILMGAFMIVFSPYIFMGLIYLRAESIKKYICFNKEIIKEFEIVNIKKEFYGKSNSHKTNGVESYSRYIIESLTGEKYYLNNINFNINILDEDKNKVKIYKKVFCSNNKYKKMPFSVKLMGEYSSDKNKIEFCDIFLSKDMFAELYEKYDSYIKENNNNDYAYREFMNDKKLTENEIIKKYFFDKVEGFNILNVELKSKYSYWNLETYKII